MEIGFKLTGTDQLAATLRALPDALQHDVLLDGLTQAAYPVARDMAGLVRRGGKAPHIADSVRTVEIRKVQGVKLTEHEVAVAVGPTKDFYYGWFLEFGTIHMAAMPFMRPAWDRSVPTILPTLSRIFWAALARSASSRSMSGGSL